MGYHFRESAEGWMGDAGGGVGSCLGPRPAQARERRAPRWTVSFLRALARTGRVRAAAADAGVDFTTAYARRRRPAAFARAWVEALRERAAANSVREDEAMAAIPLRLNAAGALPPQPARAARESPSPAAGGGAACVEELVECGGQLKRVGPGRWSKAKEQAFLAELAWSGNVRRACQAVDLSTAALSRRRLKDPYLAAAWAAAVEVARNRLNGLIVEAGNRTFDPDDLPIGEEGDRGLPKVTVAEAIQIARMGSGASRAAAAGAIIEPAIEPYDVGEVRKRLETKLRTLGMLDEQQKLAAGWTRVADGWVPPGWVKAAEARCAECGERIDQVRDAEA
jgi:hypothetical protein